MFLKTDMGLLVAIGAAGTDEPEEDSDDVTDDDEQETEKDTATVAITPDTQYLGIRAILFDPQASDPENFQPMLVAGVMGTMTKKPRSGKKKASGKKPETKFQIRRAAVKMLVKQLPTNATTGQSITARVRGAILSAQLASVHVTPLAEITTEEKVKEFVGRLVSMVEG